MPSARNGQAESKVTNKIGPSSSSRAPKQGSRKAKKSATEITNAVLNADDKSNLAVRLNRDASTSSHQTSTSSDSNEKIAGQKIVSSQIKPKHKSKQKKSSKTRKKKKSVKEKDERIDHKIKTEVGDNLDEQSDDLSESLNDSLRWDNVCSDSEEEIERLRTYKENRRARYIEALEIKIVKRISHQ